MNDYSEDTLVEQPTIALFAGLGWETANYFYEKFGEKGTLRRKTTSEVMFVHRLALLWGGCTHDLRLLKLLSRELDVEGIYA